MSRSPGSASGASVRSEAATALKERERDDCADEIARLKSKVGEITMDNELLYAKSGEVVGIADVLGSLSPISSPLAYAEAEPKHRIPPSRQDKAFADGWRTLWVLSNVRPLISPVPYKHPSGAVICQLGRRRG
jgi:hypothetical protein